MSRAAAAITLVVASVIVYHNALWASFFDDDFQWLVGSWSFQPSQLVAFGSLSHFYRPVIDTYFAVMTPLVGGSPVLFHAVNIAVHAATALVVFALAARIAGDRLYGFLAALFFAVQPSAIDAVAWVSAISESGGTLLGCLALLWFLRWRDEGKTRDRWLSVGAFVLALLTHEGSVVFLPVIVMLDWLRGRTLRVLPYAIATAAYLAIDLYINSRNYVVSEGHYAIGLHMIRNALDYIDALYVGRHDMVNDALIAVGIVLLLWFGNARVRFATLWMLLALAPYLAFTWGNTSRYLYQPAVGFSMLVAEGARGMGRGARAVSGGRMKASVASVVIGALIAIRFATFAAANVDAFVARSQVYARFLADFRRAHGDHLAAGLVDDEPPLRGELPLQFANAAIQWEYRTADISFAR